MNHQKYSIDTGAFNAKCIFALRHAHNSHSFHFINKIALNMHFKIQREGFQKLEIAEQSSLAH